MKLKEKIITFRHFNTENDVCETRSRGLQNSLCLLSREYDRIVILLAFHILDSVSDSRIEEKVYAVKDDEQLSFMASIDG